MLVGRITNAPHVPRLRAFMDAREMVRDPLRVFERYRRQMGPTFTLYMGGGRAAIVSTDPDFVRHVLQQNSGNYQMSDIRVKRMGEFQGHGLLNSHGEEWLEKRRFLGKGFTPNRLAGLVPMQERVLREALLHLDDAAERGPVDINRFVLWVNFRLFGRSIFGSRMTDEEIEQIATTIKTIQGFIVRQIVQPYLIPWYRVTGKSRYHQKMRVDAERIVRDFIASRRGKTGEAGGDLLEIMLETPYPEPGRRMSDAQVLIESLQLFVAGNETSPTALSWALYLLGQRPEIVHAMRDEVNSVFGSDPFTFEGLHQLQLVRRVLEETLRLYPSFWMIDRVALESDQVGPFHVPAGLTVLTYLYGLHRNADVWRDPETFDPGRFEPEAKKGRSRFSYLPFGGGPRKCIGSSMAVAQMLLVLAGLVRRYDFELATRDPVEIKPMMILHPKSAIQMRVTRAR